ncbi:MAG: hypothetical protein H0Z24_06040 [Thermosipho sp. (in: Bacteria)]|nr:hypothetical protein [Thermosipho sp. (in: thermotogales)]
MENENTIVLILDMKKDKKLLKKIIKKYDNPTFYLVIDENIISLAAEILISNGWLGSSTVDTLKNVLINNLKQLREIWIKFAKSIKPNIVLKEADGNIKKILEEKIATERIKEIIVPLSKGYNPYWNIVKHILEEISKRYKVKVTIIS